MSVARRLARGTDADRVLAAVIDPLYAGATAREIACDLRLPVEYVEEQCAQIAAERGLSDLLARADVIRAEHGFTGDAVAFLDSLLTRAVIQRARTAQKALSRLTATSAGANQITGGARPPDQSRGASPPRNGDGGPSQDVRGSKVTGLGAHR